MPSSSSLPVIIRKANKQDYEELLKDMHNFGVVSLNPPKFNKDLVFFIARAKDKLAAGGKILGYSRCEIVKSADGNFGRLSILAVRKGMEKKGIGNKLLGKSNEFFKASGVKRSSLTPLGDDAKAFYNHTNYRRVTDGEVTGELEWQIRERAKIAKARRARVVPKIGLSPQNLMLKDRFIRRKR
jgi:N-acetylglutamate synthase-like GNAT family acetyltransferase